MNESANDCSRFTLVGEPGRHYIVFPSWAEFSYRWEDLPRLLADPLATPYTDPVSARYTKENKAQYWIDLGYPVEHIKKAHLIDGPGGGGIVWADLVRRERWLPFAIFSRVANNRVPSEMIDVSDVLTFRVTYLEPYADPLLDYLEGRKRTKLYLCGVTPEHIESEPGSIYWVIEVKKGRRRLDALEQLPEWSRAFGLEVGSLPEMPAALREEVSSWFTRPGYDLLWWTVVGGGNGAGYHYAVAMYMALHLRFVIGPRIRCLHLLASIEGKPRARVNWAVH